MAGSADANEKPVHLRLFDFSEEEITDFNHYQILGLDEPERATPFAIKQAYRKASIRYHPDKTGRDESDYVFIAVKNAWDTLSDVSKRQAYDSTEMPFDDDIPPDVANGITNSGLLYSDEDFYDTFGPVFERNLRFDTRLQQQTSRNSNVEIPSLGGPDTPIEHVQAFYDYWTQFESWRDFSQKASEELFENNNPLEDAESRYEKRFYQKEIDKRAKALKRQEMNRIQTLVQRAMGADPRLRKYYQEQKEAKEKAALERKLKKEQEDKLKREEEERRQKEEEERLEREKQQKAQEKAEREKEKKQLRKVKQQLRKVTVATFQELADKPEKMPFLSLEEMSDEVEFLCGELSLMEIQELTDKFAEERSFSAIQKWAEEKRRSVEEEKKAKARELAELQQKMEEEERKKRAEQAKNKEWTPDELATLAKAVKKFPKVGANRWDLIASYINNNCRPEEPKTKEECIEKYNQQSKGSAIPVAPNASNNIPADNSATLQSQDNGYVKKNSNNSVSNGDMPSNGTGTDAFSGSANPKTFQRSDTAMTEASTALGSVDIDTWTDEQDKVLQEALAKYPTNMDKNERWACIAKMVDGKTKKQCVQRFKAIREAIKSKK